MSASVNVRSVWVVHWHKVCVCARSYVSFDLKRDINKEQTCKTTNRILLNIFLHKLICLGLLCLTFSYPLESRRRHRDQKHVPQVAE